MATVIVGSTWSSGANVQKLNDGSSDSTLAIGQDRVGIGTTSPSFPMDVNVSNGSNWAAGIKNTGSYGYGLNIQIPTADGNRLFLQCNNDSDDVFHVQGSGVAYFGGNVGIGNTAPGAKLEVQGSAATAGNESIALKVTDGSVKMFEVVDDQDTNNKNVTVFRSMDKQICVVPKSNTSAAIQEAVDYLVAKGNGGTVYLPADTYTISSDIHIGEGQGAASGTERLNGWGIQIIGAGAEATILQIGSGGTAINAIHIRGGQRSSSQSPANEALTASAVVIKNLKITLVGATDDLHTGIYNEYGEQVLIENVQIMTHTDSLRFRYGIRTECWNTTIFSCGIGNTSYAGILLSYGQLSDPASTYHGANINTIQCCNIRNFYRNTTSYGYGIWVAGQGGGTHYCFGTNIIATTLENDDQDYGVGVYIDTNAEDVKVSGCYFELNDKGVEIHSKNNTIIGNFYTSVTTFIDLDSSKTEGNILLGNSENTQAGGYTNSHITFYKNVGIGTTSPGEKLEVNGKIKCGDNIVLNGHYLSGDGGNEGIYIDSTGQVGIGTTSPDWKFSVSDTTGGTVTHAIFGQDKTSGESQIAIGEEDTYEKSFNIGFDHTNKYGFLQVSGDPIGTSLVVAYGNSNGGAIGIGQTSPASGLHIAADAGGSNKGYITLEELGTQSVPVDADAPAADRAVLYLKDDGNGKTRLMVRFATGAPIQLAIQP